MAKSFVRGMLAAGALVASSLVPSVASAATFVFSFNGLTLQSTSGVTNALQAVTTSGETVNVRVSAWTLSGTSGAGTISKSTLGLFGANGLGSTSTGESSSTNTHTVDNEINRDFLLFQFSKPVDLVDGRFTPFAVGGTATDTDYTVGFGTTATPWTTQIDLTGQSLAQLTTLFGGALTNYAGATAGGVQTLGTPVNYANMWMVGASFSNTGTFDAFKFSQLTANTAPVPESATWMMMIAGFGLVGASLRRKRAGIAQLA